MYIQQNSLSKMQQILLNELPTLTFTSDINETIKLYDKRNNFNFPIVSYPFPDSNIPSASAYGGYM